MVGGVMIHFGLDPGRVVRYIGGEYTGDQRGVPAILSAVIQPYISDKDYDHMECILTLTRGFPHELSFRESAARRKRKSFNRGNQKRFEENVKIVKKNYQQRS